MTEEKIPMYVKHTIRSLRERLGISQLEASRLLKISQPTLRNWEKDSSKMSWEDIQKVTLVYHIPQDFIFFGTTNAFSEKVMREV